MLSVGRRDFGRCGPMWADEIQCKGLIEKAVETYGRVDMLVNNAGLAASAMFDDFPDPNLFKHTVEVIVTARVRLTPVAGYLIIFQRRRTCLRNLHKSWMAFLKRC